MWRLMPPRSLRPSGQNFCRVRPGSSRAPLSTFCSSGSGKASPGRARQGAAHKPWEVSSRGHLGDQLPWPMSSCEDVYFLGGAARAGRGKKLCSQGPFGSGTAAQGCLPLSLSPRPHPAFLTPSRPIQGQGLHAWGCRQFWHPHG